MAIAYIIVTAPNPAGLIARVSERTREGWLPLGGVSYAHAIQDRGLPEIFMQALIREAVETLSDESPF